MAAFVIGALIAGAVGAGGAAFTGAAIGAAFLSSFATRLVPCGLSKVLTKDPPPEGGTVGAAAAQGRLITVRQAISPRQVIVGEVRVGGDLTFIHFSADNQYAHLIVTLAGHQCAAFGDIYFNDETVPIDGSGNATGKYAGYVRIQTSLGDEAGAQAFADLVLESDGKWTSAQLKRGGTKLYARLKF